MSPINLIAIEADDVLSDPSASFWLKQAINESLNRDPVDAINDAEVLVAVLHNRLEGF